MPGSGRDRWRRGVRSPPAGRKYRHANAVPGSNPVPDDRPGRRHRLLLATPAPSRFPCRRPDKPVHRGRGPSTGHRGRVRESAYSRPVFSRSVRSRSIEKDRPLPRRRRWGHRARRRGRRPRYPSRSGHLPAPRRMRRHIPIQTGSAPEGPSPRKRRDGWRWPFWRHASSSSADFDDDFAGRFPGFQGIQRGRRLGHGEGHGYVRF